jgi:DNA-binding response OmpR family regulator
MCSVLVVEDSADLRDMYAEILLMEGHEVRTAESAGEAAAELARELPQVLLLDLGISGGAVGLLGNLGPQTRIILASGARDLAEQAQAMGAAAYLLKPFTPEQLVAAIAKVTSAS